MREDKLIEYFHIMWDNFPVRARLIRKGRTVLAVNKAAMQEDLEPGVKCIDMPPREAHAGCKANQALKEGRGMYDFTLDGKRIRYWVPLEGVPDVYVHFSIPIGVLEEAPDI